jgi:uncharacterized membrane protein
MSTFSAHVMGKGRIEAFTDGVIAIIVTIMVLELKVPHGTDATALLALWPTFVAYAISFVTIAIYWVNHHQMFHQAKRIDHAVLWANLLWLFFLSLVPFFTAYLGESHVSPFAAMLYSGSMTAVGLAYLWLRYTLACEYKDDAVYQAAHRDAARKHIMSILAYVVTLPLALVHPFIPVAAVLLVAGSYFLPDAWVGEGNAAQGEV